ncbi:MAG: hypothetical protein V4726_18480 [Verrucomicrobiota bacterium]
MSDAIFPSGQWVGFYTYGKDSQRHLMDLILEFKNGFMTGEGSDGIGLFNIGGRYYPEEGECFWTKTYVRAHSVEYTGFRETKGIWGTWEIGRHSKGGFHIWPIGTEAPSHEMKEKESEPAETTPAVPLPQPETTPPEPVPAPLLAPATTA